MTGDVSETSQRSPRRASKRLRALVAPVWRSARSAALDVWSGVDKILSEDRTALTSFPRSGNTWMRALLEEATGEQTGSVYRDVVMPRGWNGIAVKTHETDRERYTRALHLVRDPRDVVLSYYHWKRDIAGRDPRWNQHVQATVRGWCSHTRHWLAFDGPYHRVRFEDLREDPPGTLTDVLDWMDIPATDEAIQEAVERTRLDRMRRRADGDTGDAFFRKGRTGEGVETLPPEASETIMSEAGELMETLGYHEQPRS